MQNHQKSKARELSKRLKTADKKARQAEPEIVLTEHVNVKQHWLPWVLLVMSWGLFLSYYLVII
ncbi:MAG: DUF2956 family protein [Gammaproteobacteria bacterium]|nr:DUF2956 family protein [Gammaproteobacteria bacterium]